MPLFVCLTFKAKTIMTKEEYLRNELYKYTNSLFQNNNEPCWAGIETVFKAGFNAGCEYYRKHVLELGDTK